MERVSNVNGAYSFIEKVLNDSINNSLEQALNLIDRIGAILFIKNSENGLVKINVSSINVLHELKEGTKLFISVKNVESRDYDVDYEELIGLLEENGYDIQEKKNNSENVKENDMIKVSKKLHLGKKLTRKIAR